MMNDNNEITVQTALYGFIAEAAHSDRFSVTLNKLFKENSDNAMMIPMNIRPDDVAFTISQMRHSKLNGAFIAPEYQREVKDYLDNRSDDVEKWGLCDWIEIHDGKLYGYLLVPHALHQWCNEKAITRMAIIGATDMMGAFSALMNDIDCAYFDEEIEALAIMVPAESDINRLAVGLSHDLGSFDAMIDFRSEGAPIEGISTLPKIGLDCAKTSQPSRLRDLLSLNNLSYSGYDVIMPKMCETVYQFLKERKL